jgi:Rab proteins geranylgeranyltransferase component A
MPLPENEVPSQSAEALLKPYLDATLSLVSPASDTVQPLFTLFYLQLSGSTSSETRGDSIPVALPIRYTTSYQPHLPEIGDSAATIGESNFWEVVKALESLGRHPGHITDDEQGEGGDGAVRKVESFWPPLEYIEESEEW